MAAADASGGVTEEQAQLVVLGSHQDTWLDGYLGPSFRIAYDSSNPTLARFAAAAAPTRRARAPTCAASPRTARRRRARSWRASLAG